MSILLLVIGLLHCVHGLTQYVVYPANKQDVSTCSQINNALVKVLGKSKVQIYKSQSRQTTEFWFVHAFAFQQTEILQIPGVRMVVNLFGWGVMNSDSFLGRRCDGKCDSCPEL